MNSFQVPRLPAENDAEQRPPLPQPRRKVQKKAADVPQGEFGDGKTGRRMLSPSLMDSTLPSFVCRVTSRLTGEEAKKI